MNTNEFLSKLNDRLYFLPKMEADNLLDYYKEIIEERLENGQSEAQAIESLGNIDDLVDQLIDSYGLDRRHFDINLQEKSYTCSNPKIRRIDLENTKLNLEILPGDSQITFDYYSCDLYDYSIRESGDTLKIAYVSKSGKISDWLKNNEATIRLSLPKGLDSLDINNISGDIKIRDLDLREYLCISTISGNISADSLKAEKVIIDTIIGNLNLLKTDTIKLDIDNIEANVNLQLSEGKEDYHTEITGLLTSKDENKDSKRHVLVNTIVGKTRISYLR